MELNTTVTNTKCESTFIIGEYERTLKIHN
jgi:hypothetical protein